jgi:DNA polymerase-1
VLAAESPEEAWDEVLGAFASVGLGEEEAVIQARLARILHFEDHDGTRPILWVPPYVSEVC